MVRTGARVPVRLQTNKHLVNAGNGFNRKHTR
jgi:hypothetical protein